MRTDRPLAAFTVIKIFLGGTPPVNFFLIAFASNVGCYRRPRTLRYNKLTDQPERNTHRRHERLQAA